MQVTEVPQLATTDDNLEVTVRAGSGRSVVVAPERTGRSSRCKTGEIYDKRSKRCRKTRKTSDD